MCTLTAEALVVEGCMSLPQDRVPSWIRAHFILEQDLEQRRMADDPASQPAAVCSVQCAVFVGSRQGSLPSMPDHEQRRMADDLVWQMTSHGSPLLRALRP